MLVKKRKAYAKRRAKIYDEIEQLRQQIEGLEKKQDRLRRPQMTRVFKPLMDKVSKKLGAVSYEWLGPFGLNSEFGIHFSNGKITKDPCEEVFASLSLVSRKDGYHLRNYLKEVQDYPKGSIAEMNGDNYEVISPNRKMNITWLAEFAKRKEK